MGSLKLIRTLVVILILKESQAWISDRDRSIKFEEEGISSRKYPSKNTLDDYYKKRREAMLYEESKTLGSDLLLSVEELKANDIIMEAKSAEYVEGLGSPNKFAPAQHLFEVLDKIENSKLFKIISTMPKGAVLHTHSTAMGSTDLLIKLTYRADLWGCNTQDDGLNIIGFEFSKKKPTSTLKQSCTWKTMDEWRKARGKQQVEKHLRRSLTLHPKTKYKDNNEVWLAFESIFDLVSGLLHFAPARKEYFYGSLEEFHKDGVQYVEIRSSLSTLYDIKGSEVSVENTMRLYEETINEFMRKHPSFCGCKLIISPFRRMKKEKLDKYIKNYFEMRNKFPDLIAGFDLVGQEELGRPLIDMLPKLLDMHFKDVPFFFHAGETNWHGSTVDENLIDAVLMRTKRIGHGYAITKHPLVLDLLKEQEIAVEINPFSNQVLQLVSDLRNHPAAYLFSDNYPVVVSSDDPSFWNTTPLSHDFYVAFLGIASAHADLKFLKKLALNSILYSSLLGDQKAEALARWVVQWDAFIKNVITKFK